MWCPVPTIPALGRLKQVDCCKFEASSAYRVRPSQRGRERNKQTGTDRDTEIERNKQAYIVTETDRQT